jgi:hypothetical protein
VWINTEVKVKVEVEVERSSGGSCGGSAARQVPPDLVVEVESTRIHE